MSTKRILLFITISVSLLACEHKEEPKLSEEGVWQLASSHLKTVIISTGKVKEDTIIHYEDIRLLNLNKGQWTTMIQDSTGTRTIGTANYNATADSFILTFPQFNHTERYGYTLSKNTMILSEKYSGVEELGEEDSLGNWHSYGFDTVVYQNDGTYLRK